MGSITININNFPNNFMTNHNRRLQMSLNPRNPVINTNICSAYGTVYNLDFYLTFGSFWNRNVFNSNTRFRSLFYNGKHGFTHIFLVETIRENISYQCFISSTEVGVQTNIEGWFVLQPLVIHQIL